MGASSGLARVVFAEFGLQLFGPGVGQFFHLRCRYRHDVWLPGITGGKVLVVLLGRIKGFQGLQSGDDAIRIHARGIQLADIRLGYIPLLWGLIEYRGAILAADIVTLSVELGRIVS